MHTQDTTTVRKDQHIYVGIDVHKKDYRVQVLGEYHQTGPAFTQQANPDQLIRHLHSHYPDAVIHCVYEAGFSGFQLYRKLQQAGFDCIVVHPADIPTTDKEKRTKSDKVDAKKLALQLRSNVLKGIYVPEGHIVAFRNLVRTRKRLVRTRTSFKNRIKHFLYMVGISIPSEYEGKVWTKDFLRWLQKVPVTGCDQYALQGLIDMLNNCEERIKQLRDNLEKVSKQAPYQKPLDLLETVPGVGRTTAQTLLAEIGDMHRFKMEKHLFSYVGLVPHLHASGENEYVGGMTIRGNKWIKEVLIESAWKAIGKDPALFNQYHQYKKRMNGNKAIVRIAKKLLRRIRRVMLIGEPYQLAVQ